MKLPPWSLALVVCLFSCASIRAQSTGRVECPRDDGYVYLYSSMTTLEIRATVQCGDIVQITGRYDNYYSVRTARGDAGFIPLSSIALIKDQVGPSVPAPATSPGRERMHYDEPATTAVAPALSTVPAFTLRNNTQIRVKLLKTISSATAHVDDAIEFEVLADVFVDGVAVLRKGARVNGVTAQAESKKRFGHDGQLAFRITSMQLADGERAALRCYHEAYAGSSASKVNPLAAGKDVSFQQGTEFVALVDGDVPLKRDAFSAMGGASAPASQTPTHAP
jgi:hypothetical protein